MVGFGGGEHLLWRAVNIDCCRLGVVSRVQQEKAADRDSSCDSRCILPLCLPHKDSIACVSGTDPLFLGVYMRECVFAFI